MEHAARHYDIDVEKPSFNRASCIEATKLEVNADIYDTFADRLSLAEKFLSDEVLPASLSGTIQLQSINANIDTIKSEFSLGSSNYDAVISGFGDEIYAEAIKQSLGETLQLEQIEHYVDAYSAQQIAFSVKNKTGTLISQGWQVYSDNTGHAVLIIAINGDNPSELAFKTVNVDELHEKNPDFVKNKVRGLYKAGFESKLANNISYNLAVHELRRNDVVPGFLSELAAVSETELQGVQNIIKLVAQENTDESQRVGYFLRRLTSISARMPDGRNMYLDTYLQHQARCPSESREVRMKAIQELNIVYALKATSPHSSDFNSVIKGQETFQYPIIHTPEFLDDAIALESEALEVDESFLRLLNRTSDKRKGIESTQKELQRRAPRTYQFIERFKAALGSSVLDGSNFDDFFKSAVSTFSLNLGSSLAGYGVKTLDDAEKVIGQSLYTSAYKLSDKNEWAWEENRSDLHRTRVDLKNENLRDTLLFLAIKTVQQKAVSGSTKRGADQVMQWLQEKYTGKVAYSKQKLDQYEARKKSTRRLMHNLGIPKQQISRLVDYVKSTKIDKYQDYDHTKFGILFRTLVYSKQGLVDLNSKAVQIILSEIYPDIKAEEWDLLKY